MEVVMTERPVKSWWLGLLQGIATLILGLFLVISPGMTTAVLVTFLGAYWLVRGVFAIVEIFTGDSSVSWGWLLTLGILGILAGLVVLRHPLYSAVIVPTLIVLLLGIDALIMGVVNFIRSFSGGGIWTAVLGVVDVIIGALLLASPVGFAIALPVALGILAVIGGIVMIVVSIRDQSATSEMTGEKRMAA